MKKSLLLFCFIFVVDFVFLSYSQSVTDLPYFESFEDKSTYGEWNLKVGGIASNAKAFNQWHISSAEHFQGKKSLMISSDIVDTSAVYVSSVVGMMVAYRDFELPQSSSATETYDLSFAWRCAGESDEGGTVCNDGLYVLWIPATQTINSSILFDAKYEQMALEFDVYGNKRKFLNSSFEWQVANAQVTASRGVTMRLVFIWRSNSNTTIEFPSACIDNIQLGLAEESCLKPSDLVVVKEGVSKLRFSWQGYSDSYEVMYHSYFGGDTIIKSVKNNYCELNDLPDGLYNFYVRGICLNDLDSLANDTTIWSVLSEYLLYSTIESCVDISDFSSSGTECWYGLHSSDWMKNPKKGVVDYGPQNIESRHTVHYQPYEFDPRTGGELSTVPEGDVLSVRLGNWDRKGNAESVIYTIDVPEESDMMILMKYAVVFENPYCKDVQRFQLDILDERGELVDPDCGHVIFLADSSSYEWNKYVYTEYYSGTDEDGNIVTGSHDVEVLWRDWTTVGVNLRDYMGEQVKIRLTVMDCALRNPVTEVGHYGYVYYTLQCESAKIEGVSCGENPTQSVVAPEGFDYEWYNVGDLNTVVCYDREMSVEPTDTSVYECKCMFVENHDCFFTLEVNLAPRYPVAQFIPQWVPDSCKNRMKFQSTSVVKVAGGVTGDKIESHYWEFDNGIISQEESPVLDLPDEGGVIKGTLTVSIADGLCFDTYEFECEVPTILTGNDTIREEICSGESYRFAGQRYYEAGEYISPIYRNRAGCDSVCVLLLSVIEKIESEVYDTIYDGETYDLNGIKYSKSGVYMSTIPSSGGCDSVITLYLTVLQTIKVEFGEQPEVCEGDSLFSVYFDILQGQYDSYNLIFDSNALAEGFENEYNIQLDENRIDIRVPTKVTPNKYTVTVVFKDSFTKDVEVPLTFVVYYSKDIMIQKFNNLLVIKDSEHNGGYEFEDNSYQWYRNNEILQGATSAYYYSGHNQFEDGDCFYFEATRISDGVRIRSCEFCTFVGVGVDDVYDNTIDVLTVVKAGERVVIDNIGDCNVCMYSISGQMIYCEVFDDLACEFRVPYSPGIYLLYISTLEDSFVTKIIVK